MFFSPDTQGKEREEDSVSFFACEEGKRYTRFLGRKGRRAPAKPILRESFHALGQKGEEGRGPAFAGKGLSSFRPEERRGGEGDGERGCQIGGRGCASAVREGRGELRLSVAERKGEFEGRACRPLRGGGGSGHRRAWSACACRKGEKAPHVDDCEGRGKGGGVTSVSCCEKEEGGRASDLTFHEHSGGGERDLQVACRRNDKKRLLLSTAEGERRGSKGGDARRRKSDLGFGFIKRLLA